MPFSWSETIVQGSTMIKASHISELKTNIDIERVARALPGYSWTRTPAINSIIQQGSAGSSPDFYDLRTALDQTYDRNYCMTHLATHYSTYLSNHNTNYLSTHYSSNLASHQSTYLSSNYSYCGGNYSHNYSDCACK
jgi:hypothetical protein